MGVPSQEFKEIVRKIWELYRVYEVTIAKITTISDMVYAAL